MDSMLTSKLLLHPDSSIPKEGAKQESQMENFETSHLVANLTVKKIKIKTKVKKEVNDLVVRSDYHGFTVDF